MMMWRGNRIGDAELEVVKLVALGWSCARIAEHRGRSFYTVKHQREVAMEKIGASTTAELTHWALAQGLVKNIYGEK